MSGGSPRNRTDTAMNDLAILAAKAVNGGLFVTGFALIGEMLKPKRFSGLFGAAPSVALANLLVVIVAKGHHEAGDNGIGMIVGALAMVAAALVAVPLIRRFRALRGSAVLCAAWLVLAGG